MVQLERTSGMRALQREGAYGSGRIADEQDGSTIHGHCSNLSLAKELIHGAQCHRSSVSGSLLLQIRCCKSDQRHTTEHTKRTAEPTSPVRSMFSSFVIVIHSTAM